MYSVNSISFPWFYFPVFLVSMSTLKIGDLELTKWLKFSKTQFSSFLYLVYLQVKSRCFVGKLLANASFLYVFFNIGAHTFCYPREV